MNGRFPNYYTELINTNSATDLLFLTLLHFILYLLFNLWSKGRYDCNLRL